MTDMPSYPNVPNEFPAAPTRPKSIDTSFMLWMVNAGLGLLGFAIGLFGSRDIAREEAIKSLRAQGQTVTDSQVDAAITAGFAFAGVIALVFFGLYLLFAFKMRAGRNWARIVLAVLGGLGIISGLAGLGSANAIALILAIVQIALIGGAIYLMFVKDSADYFTTAKRV